MDLIHKSLHPHLPLRGLCHFQINGRPKPLRIAKGCLKVLSTTPTLNYFYFIPSSISSNGYPVRSLKHFSQPLRQFCQSQQHWRMLLQTGHSFRSCPPIPCPVHAMHCQLWFCSTAPLQHWDLDALPSVREIFFFIKPCRLQVMSGYHY